MITVKIEHAEHQLDCYLQLSGSGVAPLAIEPGAEHVLALSPGDCFRVICRRAAAAPGQAEETAGGQAEAEAAEPPGAP